MPAVGISVAQLDLHRWELLEEALQYLMGDNLYVMEIPGRVLVIGLPTQDLPVNDNEGEVDKSQPMSGDI